MKKNISSLWAALFFVALTVIGLLTAGDYGQPLDGPSEQVILQENLKEYACLLFGEDSEQAAGYDALGIDRITESIEKDHGQAAYYLAAPLLQIREDNPELFNTLWHAYTFLWFMAGVLSVYCIMRSLGAMRVIACAASLLLYLSPRFFAEGHYNNKDIILLALTLWTIAAGIRFLQKPSFRRAVFFGLAGAIAANTRIIGFFVFGVMGLTVLAKLVIGKELNRKTLIQGITAIGSFIIVYLLVTPAFCVDPVGFIKHMVENSASFTRWTGVVIFQGAVYDPTGGLPLPRLYLPTMIAITVPVPYLVLMAIGGIYTVYLCITDKQRRAALIAMLVLLIVPMVYAVVARPLIYNGWRHFYFLYGPMVVLGGMGLMLMQRWLTLNSAGKAAGITALLLMFLYQIIGIAANHPYQYAYYNDLASDEEGQYELDYWEVSTLNAVETLLDSDERNENLPLEVRGGDHMSWFSLDQISEILTDDQQETLTVLEEDTEESAYIFSNTTYAQIYSSQPGDGYQVLFTIESYGRVIATMYERIE